MNSGALGGLLKLAIAGGLALLWSRGYLSDTIGKTVGAFTSPRPKVPFRIPGSTSSPAKATTTSLVG